MFYLFFFFMLILIILGVSFFEKVVCIFKKDVVRLKVW